MEIWTNPEYPLPHWEASFRRALEAMGVGEAPAKAVAQQFAGRSYRGSLPHCYYSNIYIGAGTDTDPDYNFHIIALTPSTNWPKCATD